MEAKWTFQRIERLIGREMDPRERWNTIGGSIAPYFVDVLDSWRYRSPQSSHDWFMHRHRSQRNDIPKQIIIDPTLFMDTLIVDWYKIFVMRNYVNRYNQQFEIRNHDLGRQYLLNSQKRRILSFPIPNFITTPHARMKVCISFIIIHVL